MSTGVAALLRSRMRDWQCAARRTLRGEARRRDVHAWRVATRRLLVLADAVLEPASGRRIARELRPGFRAAGRLRDAQVGIDLARALAPQNACARALASWLRHRLARRRRRLLRRLRAVDRRELSRTLERVLRKPRWDEPARRARVLERCDEALRQVRLRRARLGSAVSPPASHRLRIAVKRARYLSESAACLPGGDRYAAIARRLARHQRALGEVADLIVLEEQLERFVRRRPECDDDEAAALRRILQARQRARLRAALIRFTIAPPPVRRRDLNR